MSRTSQVTVVVRDKGYGTVKLDPQKLPIYKYHISKYDEESMVAGLAQSLRVLVAAGAVEVGTTQLDAERFNVKGKLISVLATLSCLSDVRKADRIVCAFGCLQVHLIRRLKLTWRG